jgi:hypothetical protein
VLEIPRTMSEFDDRGRSNSGIDNIDDEKLALSALEQDKLQR